MKKGLFVLLLVMALPAFANERLIHSGSYVLFNGADGKVYRLNSRTGLIHVINRGRLTPVRYGALPILHKGGVYRNERGERRRYLGDWRFK